MRTRSILAAIAALAIIATPVFAAGPFAQVDTGSSSIDFHPTVSSISMKLTVSGPDGFLFEQTFAAGDAASFGLFDGSGAYRPDGSYNWQLQAIAEATAAQREQMADLRASGAEAGSLQKAGKLPAGFEAMSGSFAIAQGAIVAGGDSEPGAGGDGVNRLAEKATLLATNDGVIEMSLCVGGDCPTSPNFGFDTVRLQENNLRIHFQDTSNSGSFPTSDWRIVANDSGNGGESYLAFEDSDAGTMPFMVRNGAGNDALYVHTNGNVGLGTDVPAVELHIRDGDSPALRLEQSNQSGFTPQTWDIAGNETNFFVRDVTNGSQLPFKIQPGADHNSLVITADNDVGIGTLNADADLHVQQTDANYGFKIERAGNPVGMLFEDSTNTQSWEFKINASGDFAINDPVAMGGELFLSSAGDLTIKGMLFDSSSRTVKSDFADVDARDVLSRVTDMPVTTWVYTGGDSRHMGPMAEDFYAQFGLGIDDRHIAPGDKAGVALAAIQGLNQVVEEKVGGMASELAKANATIEQLHTEKERLEERLARLEALLDVEN